MFCCSPSCLQLTKLIRGREAGGIYAVRGTACVHICLTRRLLISASSSIAVSAAVGLLWAAVNRSVRVIGLGRRLDNAGGRVAVTRCRVPY